VTQNIVSVFDAEYVKAQIISMSLLLQGGLEWDYFPLRTQHRLAVQILPIRTRIVGNLQFNDISL